jgi:hypothetical protein
MKAYGTKTTDEVQTATKCKGKPWSKRAKRRARRKNRRLERNWR